MSERNPIKLLAILIVALVLIIFIVFGVKQITDNNNDEPDTTFSEEDTTPSRGGFIGSISDKNKTTEASTENTIEGITEKSTEESTEESETVPSTTPSVSTENTTNPTKPADKPDSSVVTKPSEALTAYITISSKPTKTSYYIGDSFSTAGMKITARYSNGQTKDVTSLVKVSKPDMSRSGKQAVTITYNEGKIKAESSFDINVTTPSITISKDKATLIVGEYVSLSAKANPSSVTVTWSSSDRNIATVSSKGKVTAVSEGFAIITVTFNYGGYTYDDTCVVTVNKKEPVSSNLTVNFNDGSYYAENGIVTLSDFEGTIKSNYDIIYIEVGIFGLVDVNGTLQELDQYIDYDFSDEHKKTINLADLNDNDGVIGDYDYVEGEEYIVYVYAEDSSGNSDLAYFYCDFS